MKKSITLFALLLLTVFRLQAAEQELYAKTIVNKQTLTKGDSTLVSYVIYTNCEFVSVKIKGKKPKIKDAAVREIQGNARARLSRSVYKNKVYNTYIAAQYMVASDKVGKVTIPSLEFEVKLRIYERSRDFFDDFFGYQRPYKDVTLTVESEKEVINITERPQKTTEELINSGGHVL